MIDRPSAQTRVPDVLLERYRLGEVTPDEKAAIERRLAHDDELRQRLSALDASDDEIRRAYAPAVVAAHVQRRLDARAAGAPQGIGALVRRLSWTKVAALAGVVVLVVLTGPRLFGPAEEPADRVKGLEPAILLFRKVAEGSEPLEDGARARTGDLIRIGYRAAGSTWGLILSVDGRGTVTPHLPRDGTRAVRLSAGSQVLLDVSYELDDAPRWERFYFVAGSAPFDAAPVVEAARRAAAPGGAGPPRVLPLSMNVRQSSLLLVKEDVP